MKLVPEAQQLVRKGLAFISYFKHGDCIEFFNLIPSKLFTCKNLDMLFDSTSKK